MADITHYAIRVWHKDLFEIENFLMETDLGQTHAKSIIDYFSSVPDGSEVMMLNLPTGKLQPDSCGAVVLKDFNTGFEWRDRDDTYGPFVKAHEK